MRLSKIGRNIQSKLNQTVTSRISISNSLPATLDKEEIKKVEQNQTEPNSSLSMVEKKKNPKQKSKLTIFSYCLGSISIIPTNNVYIICKNYVTLWKGKKIEIDFALQVYTVSPLFKNMYRFFCGHTIDYLQIDKESFRLSGDNFLSWLMRTQRTEKIDPVARKRNLLWGFLPFLF